AVEAAGPGGQVQVQMQQAADRTRREEHPPPGPAPGEARGAADPALGVLTSAWVLEVWDTGPGPAPEVAERLFEPFVTGKPEGVGLGLAVARQVAEAHGGAVTWARDGGRTCFRVELPADEGALAEGQRRG